MLLGVALIALCRAAAVATGARAPWAELRSIFPRLVIDTDDAAYLFKVQRAKRTARELQDALERRAAVAKHP